MADEPPFPETKEYVRNYVFDKEHQDTYKKLMNAYNVKDRKADNRLHQQGRKKVLTDLESMAGEVEAIEHEDHVYKLLGKVLHKYENSKVDVHNKNSKDPNKKKQQLDYDDMDYKMRARELIAKYLEANKMDMGSLINDIKEGNIENVVNGILDTKHAIYQQNMTLHKMEEILPPNKDPNFYFKLANVWASKHQEDYTETDLRQVAINRDSILKNIMRDYLTSKENALKKLKPEKKK